MKIQLHENTVTSIMMVPYILSADTVLIKDSQWFSTVVMDVCGHQHINTDAIGEIKKQ